LPDDVLQLLDFAFGFPQFRPQKALTLITNCPTSVLGKEERSSSGKTKRLETKAIANSSRVNIGNQRNPKTVLLYAP